MMRLSSGKAKGEVGELQVYSFASKEIRGKSNSLGTLYIVCYIVLCFAALKG